MNITRREKRQRSKPVTDYSACNTQKRDRSSNILKRLGREGTIDYYDQCLKELVQIQYEASANAAIAVAYLDRYKVGMPVNKVEELIHTRWYWVRRLEQANAKIERFTRFINNLRNDYASI